MLDSNFLIEFPADVDCVPIVQDFFKDYLRSFDFSKEFSEYASKESGSWFGSVISKGRILHAMPTVSFSGKCYGQAVSVQIKTTDKKEFITSLNAQSMEDK
ncbi:MAG: hypothetical protein LBH25_14535 [Fibromonadaceae bacterium]|jgi:hypothetical protein|nr:hypothetical protein [Fibromonadaceae bacterium]